MFIFLFFIILKHLIEWLMLEIDKHMPFKILKMPMCILFFLFLFFKVFLILEFWFLLKALEDSWARETSMSIGGENPERR